MKTLKIILALLLLSITVAGQQALVEPQFCKFTCVSGEVRLGGLYRIQEVKRSNLSYTDTTKILSAGILLNTRTIFWHPNFLIFDASVEYAPEWVFDVNNDSTRSIPEQADKGTLKKLDLRATLFQRKMVSFTGFYNISQTYTNRDSLFSSIRTNSKNWGGVAYLRSKSLPMSLSFQQGEVKQVEILDTLSITNRQFEYTYKNIEGRIGKSFGNFDKHELILSRNDFKRINLEIDAIPNRIDDIILNNEVFFDRHRRHRFYSTIDHTDQTGYDTLTRLQTYEIISFKLPAHFDLIGNFNYYNVERRMQSIDQQTYRGILRHKLFESLMSDIYYEYTISKQTDFDEKDTRKGLDLAYEKKIPTGTLNLSYNLMLQNQQKSGSSNIHVFHEAYKLNNGHIVYLRLPDIDINSVVVKDSLGNIIYQLNFDYLLIPHGRFIEIARKLGGLIIDGQTVYVDYIATSPGDYQYDVRSQSFGAGLTLFQRLIGLTYRKVNQDYYNIKQSESGLTLNYIDQQIYGIRTEYKSVVAGFEYDDNSKSSIMPYQLKRYYFNWQAQFNQKLMFTLSANYNDYYLVQEDTVQTFTDASGMFVYSLTARSRINFDLGYRQQRGAGIDLDMVSSRLEFATMIRRLSFTIGVQSVQRNYLNEVDNYNCLYFRLSRRF